MRWCIASIALLALPTTLAAVAANFHLDSDPTPSRPEPADRMPRPTTSFITSNSPLPNKEYEEDQRKSMAAFLRLQARNAEPAKKPKHHHGGGASSSSSAPPDASVTELAVFTAAGVPYTVTSLGGTEEVDGKTLVPGGPPLLIGGVDVEEAKNGALDVNGTKVKFFTATPSSSLPGSRLPPTPSATVPPSSSSAPAASSSSSTSNGAPALPTRAVGAGAAVLGAMVGVLVL